MNKDSDYNVRYTLIILTLLLIPTKNIYLFFIASTLIIFLFSFKAKATSNVYMKVSLGIIYFILIGSSIRFFSTFEPNIRDIMEGARYLPVFLIFLYIEKWKKIKVENMIDALFIYVVVDAVISVMQYNKIDYFGAIQFISGFYNSNLHYEISLDVSNRALGLSVGPGQHGSIMLFSFVVFINSLFHIKNRKIMIILGTFLTIMNIVLSQSRTAFFALVIALGVVLLLNLLKSKTNIKIKSSVIIAIVVACFPFFISFLERFKYLYTIMLYGTDMSSFNARESKWERLINYTFEKPEWIFIGHGKDYFGEVSGHMDSEYVYLYGVYGLIFFVLVLLVAIIYLIKVLFKWNLANITEKMIFLMIITGAVVGIPSAFFTDPKLLIPFSLIITINFGIYSSNNSLKNKLGERYLIKTY